MVGMIFLALFVTLVLVMLGIFTLLLLDERIMLVRLGLLVLCPLAMVIVFMLV
jgi:hypothetical protein